MAKKSSKPKAPIDEVFYQLAEEKETVEAELQKKLQLPEEKESVGSIIASASLQSLKTISLLTALVGVSCLGLAALFPPLALVGAKILTVSALLGLTYSGFNFGVNSLRSAYEIYEKFYLEEDAAFQFWLSEQEPRPGIFSGKYWGAFFDHKFFPALDHTLRALVKNIAQSIEDLATIAMPEHTTQATLEKIRDGVILARKNIEKSNKLAHALHDFKNTLQSTYQDIRGFFSKIYRWGYQRTHHGQSPPPAKDDGYAASREKFNALLAARAQANSQMGEPPSETPFVNAMRLTQRQAESKLSDSKAKAALLSELKISELKVPELKEEVEASVISERVPPHSQTLQFSYDRPQTTADWTLYFTQTGQLKKNMNETELRAFADTVNYRLNEALTKSLDFQPGSEFRYEVSHAGHHQITEKGVGKVQVDWTPDQRQLRSVGPIDSITIQLMATQAVILADLPGAVKAFEIGIDKPLALEQLPPESLKTYANYLMETEAALIAKGLLPSFDEDASTLLEKAKRLSQRPNP